MHDQNFGRQIQQRRKEMKLSLRALSQTTGLSTATISRIENGVFSTTLDNAVRLAAALEISLPVTNEIPITPNTNSSNFGDVINKQATNIVDYSQIAMTVLRPGSRRNLSKIAARNGYLKAILLRGSIQLRANDGFREKLTPGATINCSLIANRSFFAIAAREAELLWIG